MIINGDLDLRRSSIEFLSNIEVNSFLDLRDTKNIVLGKNIKIYGNLHLQRSELTSLPEDIEIFGDIFLGRTKMTEFPKKFKITGKINLLHHSGITREYIEKNHPELLERCTWRD